MKTIEEADMSNQIGVPRKELKAWREDGTLIEGVHWTHGAKGSIRYTTEGSNRVIELLAEKANPARAVEPCDDVPYTFPTPEAETGPVAQPEPVVAVLQSAIHFPDEPIELTVTKVCPNQQLLVCGDKRVRLRDNKNFVPGMKLKARPSGFDATLFLFTGRHPRFRGVW